MNFIRATYISTRLAAGMSPCSSATRLMESTNLSKARPSSSWEDTAGSEAA